MSVEAWVCVCACASVFIMQYYASVKLGVMIECRTAEKNVLLLLESE